MTSWRWAWVSRWHEDIVQWCGWAREVIQQHYIIQVASLASATFVCKLGREQQYTSWMLRGKYGTNHDQLSATLAPPSWGWRWLAVESLLLPETPKLEPPSWPQRWLAAESPLLPETPWLEPPSWRWHWLATESVSLLEIPSQEIIYVNMQLTQPDPTRPVPTLQAGLTVPHE